MIRIDPYDRDEDLLDAARESGESRIRVAAVPEIAVVIGRGSRPEVELNVNAVRQDRVPVLRRPGGGCAVVLDPGNVVVSVAEPQRGIGKIASAFGRLSDRLIEALAGIGVAGIVRGGVSDLVLRDRKIGGACIHSSRDLLYYSTTLLVDPDPELSERYLAHPPREPDYRRGRSHRDFMGSLARVLGSNDVGEFVGRLDRALTVPVPPHCTSR